MEGEEGEASLIDNISCCGCFACVRRGGGLHRGYGGTSSNELLDMLRYETVPGGVNGRRDRVFLSSKELK